MINLINQLHNPLKFYPDINYKVDYQSSNNIWKREGTLFTSVESWVDDGLSYGNDNFPLPYHKYVNQHSIYDTYIDPSWIQGFISGGFYTIPQDTCFIHNRFVVDLNKNLTKNNFKSLVNKRVFCLEINLDGLDRFVGVLLRNHFQNGCIVKLYRQIDCINGQKRAFTHNYTYIITDFKKIYKFFQYYPMLTEASNNNFLNWNKEVISILEEFADKKNKNGLKKKQTVQTACKQK